MEEMEQKYYKCAHCGNIIAMVQDNGPDIYCCGEPMGFLLPNEEFAVGVAPVETHLPVITVDGDKVKVTLGSMEHPTAPEHHIEWISLHTKQGNQRRALHAFDKPEVCFALSDGDEVKSAYAYCNVFGLWRARYNDPYVDE